jgi:hypothetical protein
MKKAVSSSLPDFQSNTLAFNSKSTKSKRYSSQSTAPIISFWKRIWYNLSIWMEPDLQPKITRICQKDGNEYYRVYDPVIGDSKTFRSEMEIRILLDQRSYNNSRNW